MHDIFSPCNMHVFSTHRTSVNLFTKVVMSIIFFWEGAAGTIMLAGLVVSVCIYLRSKTKLIARLVLRQRVKFIGYLLSIL